MALKIGNVFINEDDLIPLIVKGRTEIPTCVKFIYLFIYLFIYSLFNIDNNKNRYKSCVLLKIAML